MGIQIYVIISSAFLHNGLTITETKEHRTEKEGAKLAPSFKNNYKYFIMAIMLLKDTQADTMKAKLSDLLVSISWADLAKRYFNRSGSWLYHKLDGIDGNKKPTEFTKEEREQLRGALVDLSDRIRRAADLIQ